MGRIKKVIAGVLVVAVAGTGITAGLMQLKKNNEKEVMVTHVSNLIQEYYMPSTSLEGTVTTSVTQNVSLDKDLIIDQVYVSKGDPVKVGDPLVSFDTTLVEMELNIAKLKHQKLEQDLNKAVNRLNSLKNGGPIVEDSDSAYNADDLSQSDDLYGNNDDDMMAGYIARNYLAAVAPKLLLSAFSDFGETEQEDGADSSEAGSQTDTEVQQEEGPQYQDPTAGDFSSGEDISSGDQNHGFDSGEDHDSPRPSPTPTPQLPDWIDYYDPYYTDGINGITDGEYLFYETLDSSSLPLTGKGTEEEPFVFLCSSKNQAVTVMGSFFNKMAGYSEDGSRVEKEGGYWYQLEFHENDILIDYQDRKQSCTGYYLIDGSLLEKPVNMHTETDFTLADASRYEEELPDEPADPGSGTNTNTSTMSRAEAIKIQQNKIASLKLDIQESSIKITKLEKKANKKLISSKLDGSVDYVGDSSAGTSDSSTFIRVKSGDGFFVVGTVSELMLDKVTVGTKLNCVSYQSGSFQAEVIDVSEYPSDGNSYYYGDSNPNVSNYTYTAIVPDESVQLQDQDYLTITLESDASGSGTLVLQKAFVRTENGQSYVYKDDNGVLKKQELSVGATVDGGYSIIVKGGITSEDKIAFPYGKDVKEGARTKEVGMDEMYGY